MNNELLKQIVFDCAMELIYGQEGLSKEVIGNRLLSAIERHDSKDNLKRKIIEEAIEEASKVLGCDPAYYGEEGNEEIDRQLKKMGYNPDELLK